MHNFKNWPTLPQKRNSSLVHLQSFDMTSLSTDTLYVSCLSLSNCRMSRRSYSSIFKILTWKKRGVSFLMESKLIKKTNHWEKRRSQNSAHWELFWKMVPFLVKQVPKQLPYCKVPPTKHAKRAPFSKTVPLRHHFPQKGWKWCPLRKEGTVFVARKRLKMMPFWKRGTILALFLLQKKVKNGAVF